MSPISHSFYEISTLLIAAAILISAVFRVIQRIKEIGGGTSQVGTQEDQQWTNVAVRATSATFRQMNRRNAVLLILDLGWLLIAGSLLALWPESLDPFLYPRRSFVFFAAIALFPLALRQNLAAQTRLSKALKIVSKVFLITAIFVCVFMAARYLLFVRPRMEGPDFYYYVCISRHMNWGSEDLSMLRYFYFPGVYSFWRAALTLGGGSLQSLQWWYFCVIAANAILVAAVIQRVTRNLPAAVIGFLFYIGFCSRFEGYVGVTEPIATLPILFGLLAWGGRSLLGKSGLFRLIALGTGLGLGLYTRQQAGMVALGAIALALTYFRDRAFNHIVTFKRLLLLALVTASVLLVGVALEGFGLEPLRIGLENMPQYGNDDTDFFHVILQAAKLAGPISVFSVAAVMVWLVCFGLKRYRHLLFEPWCQMLGFTCVAGMLSLVPFFSRAHLHYGLVSGPLLIIASIIAFLVLLRQIPVLYRRAPLTNFLLILLTLAPFIRPTMHSPYFFVWPLQNPVKPPQQRPWRLTPGLAEDLVKMKQQVRPRENIYVLPPRQNEVHYFLGTQHSFYGWSRFVPLSDVIQNPGLNGVIVVNSRFMPDYVVDIAVARFEYDRAPTILPKYGFIPVVRLPSLTLWRRTEVAIADHK